MRSVSVSFIRPATLAVILLFGAAGTVFAQGSSRATGLKIDNDKPIQIESDRLEVREAENLAIFTGNVNVVQGPTQLKAGRMKVYYRRGSGSAATGSADIERIEVDDKVYMKSEEQVATGDQGTYDMTSETLVLTGDQVVLSEGDNVIVGCKLTVQVATGEAQLESCPQTGGRVKMLLNPDSANR